MQTDDNGLYHMRARYYNPELKRFMNRDIVSGSIEESQTLNRYAYVNGNPVSYHDPFGLARELLTRDNIQLALDFAGIIPGWGAIADLSNAGIYAWNGEWSEAGQSAFGAIPGVGDVATVAKISNRTSKIVDKAADSGNIKSIRSFGKYSVGLYNDIKGVAGMDAHHVGQKAVMKKFVKNYDDKLAPAINVPSVGHTRRLGDKGVVSRRTTGIDSPRDLLARDIFELRRVYDDIPNSALKDLIDLNKRMYPEMRRK